MTFAWHHPSYYKKLKQQAASDKATSPKPQAREPRKLQAAGVDEATSSKPSQNILLKASSTPDHESATEKPSR